MKELEDKFQQLLSEIKTNKGHQVVNMNSNNNTSQPASEPLRQKVTELEGKNEDQDEKIAVLKAAETRLKSEIEFLKSYTRNQTSRIA